MTSSSRKVLTNAELLDLLEKKKKEGIDEFKLKCFSQEAYVKSAKLYKFLKENCEISLDATAKLSQELSKYELYKFEKLQILNLLPTEESELLLLLEDYSHRFTGEQLQEILSLTRKAKKN